jgi:AcrR family transcriptional regulator
MARVGARLTQERLTQEQRSALAREKLSRAAFEVIRDVGYSGFRTAAVAKAAGVSQGGQLHHFPTKDDLAFAAIQYAFGLAREKTAGNLARFAAADEPIRAVIEDSMDFYFSSAFDVAVEVVKAASQHTALQRDIGELSRQFREFAERGWLEKLVERGWSVADAADIIELSTSLVRGFAIRKWMYRDSGQFKRLLDRWVDIVYASFETVRQRPRRNRGL